MGSPDRGHGYHPEEGLCEPTPEDFKSLALMKVVAFAEKRGCCGRPGDLEDPAAVQEELEHITLLQGTPKLSHCRVFKDEEGRALGGIQLQLPGDVGDLGFPEDLRHTLNPGEAYVEYIACHPDATGKGIGSRLLKWADGFATTNGCTEIQLDVMAKNQGAVRLYQRKGYQIYEEPDEDCCDCCFGSLFIFCCLGCTYCSVLHMKKALGHGVPEATDVTDSNATAAGRA